MNDIYKRIVSITELRRNFGEITKNLPSIESLILTRGGEPFAVLKAVPEEKRRIMKKAEGLWRHSSLDSNPLWKKVFDRKSRKQTIKI